MRADDFIALSNSVLAGQETAKLKGVSSQVYKAAIKDVDLPYLKRIMQEHDVELIRNPLPNIFNPPPYLYKLGGGDLDMKKVAIIGARKSSDYGRKIAYQLASDLSPYVMIVSGLAYGIDYMAHKGAVDHKGSTMAVLGSGILNCYPSKHKGLYKAIQDKGMIISEYGLFHKPLKHHFPFRNRLISGFSDVVIVVEAQEKSGTMITVNYGLDQGKTIMAVPGSIYNRNTAGTHRLLKEGAKVCTSVDDVLDEIIEYKFQKRL